MKTLDILEAPAAVQEYVDGLGQENVILTRKGKPIAVVLPVRDADLETVSLSLNPKFLAIMERSKRSLDREGGTSSEEIRREFGLPPFRAKKVKASGGKNSANSRKTKSGTGVKKNVG